MKPRAHGRRALAAPSLTTLSPNLDGVWEMKLRIAGALLGALALLGAGMTPAQAAEGVQWDNCGSWKNDNDLTSRFAGKISFDASDYGGPGVYYIKYKIRWQVPKVGGGWKTEDTARGRSRKIAVQAGHSIYVKVADKTGWGQLYGDSWRVNIVGTLYKDISPGIDTRYRDQMKHHFGKPKFRDYTPGLCSVSV